METTPDAQAIVLVEGVSDQLALDALATRRGHNLNARGISIVAIGGATNIGSFLKRYGPQGLGLRLAGLCDAAEEGDFQSGLERAGLGANLTRTEMEQRGFYVCVADLEDELIRALGAAAVEQVLDAQVSSKPSASSSTSLSGADEPARSSCGASSGRRGAERSNPRPCSSGRWI